MKTITVKYIKDYLLEVKFSNNKIKTIDLRDFLFESTNPMTTQFRDMNLFKKVRVEFGHLSWNGEMDLSADFLYKISIKANSGRKPLPTEDKKQLVRLYLPQRIIDKFGGMNAFQNACYDCAGYKQ